MGRRVAWPMFSSTRQVAHLCRLPVCGFSYVWIARICKGSPHRIAHASSPSSPTCRPIRGFCMASSPTHAGFFLSGQMLGRVLMEVKCSPYAGFICQSSLQTSFARAWLYTPLTRSPVCGFAYVWHSSCWLHLARSLVLAARPYVASSMSGARHTGFTSPGCSSLASPRHRASSCFTATTSSHVAMELHHASPYNFILPSLLAP